MLIDEYQPLTRLGQHIGVEKLPEAGLLFNHRNPLGLVVDFDPVPAGPVRTTTRQEEGCLTHFGLGDHREGPNRFTH